MREKLSFCSDMAMVFEEDLMGAGEEEALPTSLTWGDGDFPDLLAMAKLCEEDLVRS